MTMTTELKNLFLKKRLADLSLEAFEERQGLKRSLGPASLVLLGVGAVIGAGIFVLTGHAAARIAGPAVTLSFLLAAVACAFAGLCYAEFASMIPVAGSAYTYAYATLGEFVAWIIGWDLVLEYTVGAIAVAIGWSGYLVSFLRDLGFVVPAALTGPPFAFDVETHRWALTGALVNLPAIAVVAFITAILVLGIRESAFLNALVVVVKLVIILA
ncbi:MAG TPA: amino acid permease, partial [Nitrospira sp.]